MTGPSTQDDGKAEARKLEKLESQGSSARALYDQAKKDLANLHPDDLKQFWAAMTAQLQQDAVDPNAADKAAAGKIIPALIVEGFGKDQAAGLRVDVYTDATL